MGAITVVLAWLNLLGDIRQLPFLGIYVIMFFDVLKTFLRFIMVFLVFIIAFALGFHVLLISDSVSWKLCNQKLIHVFSLLIYDHASTGKVCFNGVL